MNVGIVCPYEVFPPTIGGPIRVFELARGLNFHGASVFILHPGQSRSINNNFNLIGFKQIVHFLGPKGFKWLSAFGTYAGPFDFLCLRKLIHLISKQDIHVIQCEGSWSVLPIAHVTGKNKIPVILDEHNVDAIAVRFASSIPIAYPYVLTLEKRAVKFASRVLAVSEQDRLKLIRLYDVAKKRVVVIPNGVNVDKFGTISKNEAKKRIGFDDEIIVLFHGALSWKANHEAAMTIARFIAPNIHKQFPSVRFLVVGQNPSWTLIKEARKCKNVLLTGYVSNLLDFIQAADICIVPLRSGSGTRLKILEYMAAGKPIVSTVVGAEGIPLRNGIHAILTKEVDEKFVDSIWRLSSEKDFAEKIGASAKDLAKSFDWKIVTKRLYDLYSTYIK